MCTEPFPPPEPISLTRVNATEMVFSWNQTQSYCPSLQYNIISTNCGNCPDTTNFTSVTCFDFPTSDSATVCTIMVQAVICNTSGTPLVGLPSHPTEVNLTGTIIHGHNTVIAMMKWILQFQRLTKYQLFLIITLKMVFDD